jgi:hypothetical protein
MFKYFFIYRILCKIEFSELILYKKLLILNYSLFINF